MPAPNMTTASSQIALMEQVINTNVETSQNLDEGIDRRFQAASAMDMGKEKYRHPIQFDVGGQAASYDPDGGPYITGNGAEYQQFTVVPIPILVAIGATELLDRISKANGLSIIDPVTRMIADVKKKTAHTRNALFQGYNQFVLATVDASYAGGNTVPMANTPFGNRLLDINNMYMATDASGNFNAIGTPTVLQKSNSTGGTIDTIQLDQAPAGLVPNSSLLLLNATSGAPLGPQGMQYLISASNVGDQDGISRQVPQVQAPAVNANFATVTLGVITALNVRQKQLLPDEDGKRFYYTHNIQQSTAQQLGFAKTTLMSTDGKLANFDIAPNRKQKWYIGEQEVETDTMAAINTLYDVAQTHLRKVRYPGSQKFLPGPLMGYWWPRYTGGQATSERDMLYQDAYNGYTNLVWCHGVVNNLGITPAMQVAI